MRTLFPWLVFLLVGTACGRLVADEPAPSHTRLKARQAQVSSLLKRYSRAGTHVDQRQRIVEEAIALGSPFTDALCAGIRRQGAPILQKYRSAFTSSINGALQITPASVVASSQQLADLRGELIRLAEFARRLEQRLPYDTPVSDASRETEAEDQPSKFAKQLSKTEEDLIQQWLLNKGYGRLNSAESALVAEVNRLRVQEELKPLEVDYKLSVVARDHSWDMVRKRFFSHTSKLPGKKTHSDRARRFGTTAAAENIANCGSAAEAMSLWMASSGHRRNILGRSFRRIGIGRVGRKFTMMFGH